MQSMILAIGMTLLVRLQRMAQRFVRSLTIWVLLGSALLLSGCVKYDVGIHIDSPNQGEIVQRIQLGERLTSFSSTTADQWLGTLERRAKQLHGKTRRSNQEIVVTIPFTDGSDLATKFNEFFNPISQRKTNGKPGAGGFADLPDLKSHLTLTQSNFLLLVRDRLRYDIDLRPLGVIAANGNVLVSPGSLLDLKLHLTTPWGASSVDAANIHQRGQRIAWVLKPSELNHLEATFWLPSPLGLGTLLIVLLVAGGLYWRGRSVLPAIVSSSPSIPEAQSISHQ